MRNDFGLRNLSDEYYVLQINGETKSCHRLYVDAITAALQLRRQFPLSIIKVRDADELTRFKAQADEDIRSSRLH